MAIASNYISLDRGFVFCNHAYPLFWLEDSLVDIDKLVLVRQDQHDVPHQQAAGSYLVVLGEHGKLLVQCRRVVVAAETNLGGAWSRDSLTCTGRSRRRGQRLGRRPSRC